MYVWEVISVMHDPKVFLHTMSAETFEGGQLSPFIIDRGESAEVRWEANEDHEEELKTSQVYLYL